MKGFASFLSEMWSLFLRISSGLACDGHRVYRFTREVWKARVWLASTHYIESEITSWLLTSKYIVVKPPKRVRGREDVKYSREPNLAPVCLRYARFGCVTFHFPNKTKHVRQGLPRTCQFYNGVSILIVDFKINYKASRVTNYLSRTLKTEI